MSDDRDTIIEALPVKAANRREAARSTLPFRPLFFRPSLEDDRRALADLVSRDAHIEVLDTLHLQLRDLVRTRQPSDKMSAEELDEAVHECLQGSPADLYGVWVYYPWSRRLIHLLDRAEFSELRTNRNRYKITTDEQATLVSKRVGVVGLSVGHSVALTLALERSCGELRLADFDTLELSNLNRIRSGVHNLGMPKSYLTAREIAELDPFLEVTLFDHGISADNIEAFLLDGGRLDLVVEECDSLDIKVIVRHQARQHRIPVIMNTSDRGMIDIERFDLEPGRPVFHGLAGDLVPGTLQDLTTEEKLPFVVRILGAAALSPRLRASMLEIDQTISTWPQLGSEVIHGGAAAAHVYRRIALNEIACSGRFFFDLDDIGPDLTSGTEPHDPGRRQVALPPTDRELVTEPLIREIVSQALLAPSGGNTQPWMWRVGDGKLYLLLDSTRTSGLADVCAAGSYLALGCAAENLILAAHAADRSIRMELFPDARLPEHVATFTISEAGDPADEPSFRDQLHAQIPLRHTNRRIGRRYPLAENDRDVLTAAIRSIAFADVQWLTGEMELAQIGDLIGIADRLRMLHPQCHGDMFRELRWSRDEVEATRDGIDVATLGLTASDMAGLELCRDWPPLELVNQWGGGRNLEKMARRCVSASSAVGLITMPTARSIDYFNGGRALQRLWLTATEKGIAVHPMTTLPYFFARLNRKGGEGFDKRTIAELQAIRPRYQQLFELSASTGEVLLFRIARADATEKRSLRRPLDDVLRPGGMT